MESCMGNRLDGYTEHDHLATVVMGLMPSARVLHRLLTAAGSAKALFDCWQHAWLMQHLPAKTANNLWNKGIAWQQQLPCYAQTLAHTNTHVVLWQAMPQRLQAMMDPPACLFARGNLALLAQPRSLGIVGTRKATEISHLLIPRVVEGLIVHQPVIVSGLADGVDGLAHKAALKHQLPTIAVMGTGLNVIYPAHHAGLAREILTQNGLLLSEYPLNFAGDKYTFPARNRIIAGLSQGILVTECPVKSGAMITARLALDNGREVLAIPGSPLHPNAAGPNQLLAAGASLVQTAQDVCDALGWEQMMTQALPLLPSALPPNNCGLTPIPVDLSADMQQVLQAIPTLPTPLEAVLQQLACQPPMAQATSVSLSLLELQGHIQLLPGQQVVRIA
jgi:DNA processing protein